MLSAFDQVRLGKVSMKITEISAPGSRKPSRCALHTKNLFQGGLSGLPKNKKEEIGLIESATEEDEGIQCRVCLSDENLPANPLVKPCMCSGSMGLVHVECLQQWFASKVITRESSSAAIYSWKSLHCELCKFNYPEQISVNGKVFDLLLLNKPKENFLSFKTDLGSGELKSVCIVSFNEKKMIRMGRATDCDIKLSDISVSRVHASLSFTEDGLVLKDSQSKFGTLVRVRQTLNLTPGVKFELQCGRNLVEITVKKPFRFLSCFSGCGRKNSQDLKKRTGKKDKKEAFEDTFHNQV